MSVSRGNLERFSGFADLYDAHRPSPPEPLGPLLASYADAAAPVVADLGSGTGLSTRWAASWAACVTGIEPNPQMRGQAEARPLPTISYREGHSHATGLADRSCDVVLAVQAMHWMEPGPTLAEVARILRPGGVFAVVDADWPPVTGLVAAEQAWAVVHRRIRVFEARVSRLEDDVALRAPIADDDPALADDDLADPHRNRAMPSGVRSWSKREHLARLQASGRFAFTRELMLDDVVAGGADRFVALLHSQGSYQGLRRRGLSDGEIGASTFVAAVQAAYAARPDVLQMRFTWRVRLGVTPR